MPDYPTNDEPNPDISPRQDDVGIHEWDGDPESLVPIYSTFPEPTARRVTPKQFEREHGYPPGDAASTIHAETLEQLKRERRNRLTDTEIAALRRIGDLWNGNKVGPDHVHLLTDKCPSWDELFAGLPDDDLNDLTPEIDGTIEELQDAFGHHDWCDLDPETPGHLETQTVLRQPIKWAPTNSAKTLLHRHADLPTPRGDRFELLQHRVGVGCAAAEIELIMDGTAETYKEINLDKVDVQGELRDGTLLIYEIMTGHNNNLLYRTTYKKLASLSRDGYKPHVVFDNRETARRVINHWCERLSADLDATLKSAPNLDWLEDKVAREFEDPERDWHIARITTIPRLWRQTFGRDAPPRTTQEITSIDW